MVSNNDYYRDTLSGSSLKRCYELAPSRIQQYLKAEINYVLKKIHHDDIILELGCGYGRILPALTQKAKLVVGIDTSLQSLSLAKKLIGKNRKCVLLRMDAVHLAFVDKIFNVVVCIQNGISAFHVNQKELIKECISITKPGGVILFSSYSEKIWNERLHWFQLQSDAGLIGKINHKKTRNGRIVCRDGFTATTVNQEQFLSLTTNFDVKIKITEVDESSLFCEIIP
jgi:ubiquinone/menaquinone biosynthesis C-methylase UbiE